MRKGYKVLFFASLLLIVGVGFLFRYRVAIVSQIVPNLESDTIHITIINDTAYINTKLIAKNKSFLPIKIDSIKYKIGIFDQVYLHEEKYLGIKLSPYSRDTFDFYLKIPTTRIIADLREIRKKAHNANYSIHVVIQYSTIFGRVDLPINKSAKFKLPTPPEIKIVKVDYTKVRIKYMLADVKVRVTNFNPISLIVKSIKYKLEIPNRGIATGDYKIPITVLPHSQLYIHLPLEINWEHIGKTALDVVQDDDSYDYILICTAEILTPNPNQKPIILEVTKLGRMELRREIPKNKFQNSKHKRNKKHKKTKHRKNR